MVVSAEEWQDRHKKHVILHTLKTGRDWSVMSPIRKLIWCDPVNICELVGRFLLLSFRGQDQQQPWQVMATIDQADIRGSEPHNHDPSGAASDY